MATKQNFLTSEGKEKLEEELRILRTDRRKDVAEKIKTAREFGDLSENAEYDEAKNEQADLEKKILEIEERLKTATIIEEDLIQVGKGIHLGSKVTFKDKKYGDTGVYTIVGSTEADPLNGFISDESPVGKALLGASKGKKVKFETPDGTNELEILSVE